MKAFTPRSARVVVLSLCAALTLPILVAASGCTATEDPKKQPGYYDGPMTPAGGGPKKGGKGGAPE